VPCWFSETAIERICLLTHIDDNVIDVHKTHGDFAFLSTEEHLWFDSMLSAEKSYNALITAGWKPQQARSVLPNSLKTEIVVTGNVREWKAFFKLRTADDAHPQMRELAIPLFEELREKLPEIFEDILIDEFKKAFEKTLTNLEIKDNFAADDDNFKEQICLIREILDLISAQKKRYIAAGLSASDTEILELEKKYQGYATRVPEILRREVDQYIDEWDKKWNRLEFVFDNNCQPIRK
jgi:hypothetical protein